MGIRAALAAASCAVVVTGCAVSGVEDDGGPGADRPGVADRADRESDRADRGSEGRGSDGREPGSGEAGETEPERSAAPERARRAQPGQGGTGFGQAVRRLRVVPERGAGYDRDRFEHWTDADGDGCDARDEVLIAEAVRAPRVGSGCALAGGRWRSVYDGVTTADPSSFDVDHVVPLAEAWASGARRWSDRRRESFANDLGDPRSLAAVSASSNRSKSDGDPADWLPDLQQCQYLRSWVAVKLRWGLAADRAEAAVLRDRAGRCGGRVAVRPAGPAAGPEVGGGSRPRPRPQRPPDGGSGASDPRFDTCTDANASGFGDYVRGRDPEYGWYDDRDGDGTVCET